ncbi:NACHT nucleoside triphosphatase [Penicillium samsonianum]|uniref:NACHT nucleoside triphosphatase n=1 Tax=Penicillium samsonianum TaxID=1882272 RepID=UPI0025494D21|nr:NACHT nucleoside triphosphatase [Penicillium samsonianum]KAJ6149060.1 NACHT nucleoside triphosphatase [Penicillium samsonianum]
MATPNPHLLNAFMAAKREFLASQKDRSLFDRISNATSIQEIHEFVMQFQAQQSNTTGMRCLRKINKFLQKLGQYSQVIEQFVQVKPDILALIWGPIKLLLQMANATTQSFDAIVDTMDIIGDKLPLFENYTMLFEAKDRVKDALILFYKDILDFFGIALNFLSLKHWKLVFESVWPKHRSKIDVVVSNIERHSFLLRDEVNLEHISEAHQARVIDFDRWAATFEFQARQNYNELETFISPRLYDDELDRFQRNLCERTGRWIQRDKAISKWLDPNDTTNRLIWLQGIPGAGKSYLSSMIVEKAKASRTTVLFVFLSYKQGEVSTISILHSLIFQLVIGAEGFDEALREDMRIKLFEIYRSSQRNLKSNTKFARETLCSLLNCVGPAHIIIDGLDELAEGERATTLREILSVLQDALETKLFISSRMEDNISRIMRKTVHKAVRVDDQNGGCIQSFVSITSQKWLSESDFDEEACSAITNLLSLLAAKAKGMFLYAKVVMDNVQMCHNPESIRNELRALPETLQDA